MDGNPQRRDVMVCQVCGRSAFPGTPHWLNQPHRDIYDLRVQRCPQHWTDWALRNTREGRTNANRAAMKEALAQPVPSIHPYAEPWSATPLPDDDEEVLVAIDADVIDSGGGYQRISRRRQAMKLLRNRGTSSEDL